MQADGFVRLGPVPVRIVILTLVLVLSGLVAFGQSPRVISGVVMTPQFELVPGAAIEVTAGGKTMAATADSDGRFSIPVPDGEVSARFFGKDLAEVRRTFAANERIDDVQIKIAYIVSPITASVTIRNEALSPEIEQRNDSVYKNSLFGRDDQLIFTLNAGINAGQHEGGGKSLEIRRFGFNLDHGGVNGGLKILVDNVQQNQGSQGHGQGYLGSLKSLSPELVRDVTIINGPFSAAYGDFSGLGVVQIELKESLADRFTARIQGGAFRSARGFFAFSPDWKDTAAFVAYEPSYTDGPFINRGRYRRDNFTGNLTRKVSETSSFGVKFNAGRNAFYSSGQIPQDEVSAGRLDRYGAVDPASGGKVTLGTASAYFRKEWASGTALKADTFVGRSLFDLYSNFTFFLADPMYGDEIQQHDSRLQQGGSVQLIKPYKFGAQSVLTLGGGFHLNQIAIGLSPSRSRRPDRKFLAENIDNPDVISTKSHADVNNFSGYAQNSTSFLDGHLRVELGLRWDYFSFKLKGYELGGRDASSSPASPCNSSFADPANAANPCARLLNGKERSARFQPKLAIAVSPFERVPISFYLNYGRGISSQDARGIIRNPSAPKLATTDFYQAGTSYNGRQLSLVASSFLIDHSNEQVYIPDDGSIEFQGRSRSYGFEVRGSLRLTSYLALNGGATQVIRAYYPGQFTSDGRRIIVDSAPHTASNASLVLSEFHKFNASLNYRQISNYRLDGEDPTTVASGLDIVDLSVSRHLRRWIDVNFSIDNLLNKRYFETQNYLESRISPNSPVIAQIHATPGYPIGISAGFTLHLGVKK